MIQWADRQGRVWRGRLYYPVSYEASRTYPLVIQTHGIGPDHEFSLSGRRSGLGPGVSIYAAQMLANRGIMTLQIEDKNLAGIDGTPQEAPTYAEAYEAAIRYLSDRHLVDVRRVGLSGFSHTGWHVEYALTHSAVGYAAALTSDNISESYLQDLIVPGDADGENGASAYGAGLGLWLERAPGFVADRIRTPLRLQVESAGLPSILSKWELYIRLRRLDLPVELYVIPDIERGSHGAQNPRQLVASQEGALDWFDFWLNGHEDPDPSKADQYRRWRRLREQRDRVANMPRPPLLNWTSQPIYP
jgi:dienelactone hydrolase